jgi:hypothetical protein
MDKKNDVKKKRFVTFLPFEKQVRGFAPIGMLE